MKEKKMKNWVFVRPRKGKEWLIGVLMLINILVVISPCINLFNVNAIVLGIPMMLIVAMGTILATLIVINIAYRWGVH